MASDRLLEPEFLRKLETLTLVARKSYAGRMKGERRTAKKGHSVEFADFRDYAPGDDLRYVDWKAYGRLDKLFLKLFREEEDLSVHLLIDNSKSMAFGAPITKARYAAGIAAALGYIGLLEYDRVTVTTFSAGLGQRLPHLRGRASIPTYLRFLSGLEAPGGQTDLTGALRRYAEREAFPGLAIVLSDFLGEGLKDGLYALLARGFEIVLIQILDPAEVEPALAGDMRLVDAETGEELVVSISPFLLGEYQARLASLVEEISILSRRHGVEYVRVTTQTPFEETVLQYLRTGGLVR
ncbi:MAG: DUF58 domain-containing protein [Capsulimonadaceae bacterium]|nr:DUF58 domain-containing protein [Capsulimonadaceae bacterium]